MLEGKLCKLCEIINKSLIARRLYEDHLCIIFKHKGSPMIMLKEHTDKVDSELYLTLADILKSTCGGGVIAGPKENTNHFHLYLIK